MRPLQGLEDAVAQLLLAGTDDPAGLMQRCLRGAMAQPLFDPASQLLLLGVAQQSMDECSRGAQLSAGQRRLLTAALSAVGVKQWWVNEMHDGLPGATAKMSLSMEVGVELQDTPGIASGTCMRSIATWLSILPILLLILY